MLPYYCAECCKYFISDEEMNDHKADKHKNIVTPRSHSNVAKPNTLMKITKIETADNIEDDIPSSISSKETENSGVNNNIRKDNVLENFVMNCKVDIEKIGIPCSLQSDVNAVHSNNTDGGVNELIEDQTVDNDNPHEGDIIPIVESVPVAFGAHNQVIDKDKIEYNNQVAQFKRLAQEFKSNNYEGEFENYLMHFKSPYLNRNVIHVVEDIENHVVQLESSVKHNSSMNCHVDDFEVIEDDDVFSDAIQFDDEEVEFDGEEVEFDDEEEEFDDTDPIIILAPVKREIMRNYLSVHFDELMKPGSFKCQKCLRKYRTRYEVIIHETVHLDMSEVYLKKGQTKHKSQVQASTPIELDPEYVDPIISYQANIYDERLISINNCEFYCYKCGRRFNDGKTLKAHGDVCDGEAMVSLCNTCLYIRKRPTNIVFCSISRLDKREGKRQCHWCGDYTSEISLLTVKTKRTRRTKTIKKLADRITFESSDEKVKGQVSQVIKRGGGSGNRGGGSSNRGGGSGVIGYGSSYRGGGSSYRGGGSSYRGSGSSYRGGGSSYRGWSSSNKGCGSNNNSRPIAKPLSNRERLKLIQTRLKLMKR